MTEFRDLQAVLLRQDNLVASVIEWDQFLFGMRVVPEDSIMESLFDTQVRR